MTAALLDRPPTNGEGEGDTIADLHLWRLGPGHLGAIVSVVTPSARSEADYRAKLARFRSLSHLYDRGEASGVRAARSSLWRPKLLIAPSSVANSPASAFSATSAARIALSAGGDLDFVVPSRAIHDPRDQPGSDENADDQIAEDAKVIIERSDRAPKSAAIT